MENENSENENSKIENEELVSDESSDVTSTKDADVDAGEEKTESVPAESPVDLPAVEDDGSDVIQAVTVIDTPAGTLSVVHDITLGDLVIATLLMAHLIFIVLYKLIRRY